MHAPLRWLQFKKKGLYVTEAKNFTGSDGMTSAAAEVTEHMEKMGECNGACVCVYHSYRMRKRKKGQGEKYCTPNRKMPHGASV